MSLLSLIHIRVLDGQIPDMVRRLLEDTFPGVYEDVKQGFLEYNTAAITINKVTLPARPSFEMSYGS